MKTFLLLSAIPGSGKSTWAKKYALEHENVHIVSSDGLREELGGAINNFDHEKEVWDLFLKRIHEYGKQEDVTVIADATMISNNFRKFYAINTPEFDRHVLVFFDIPYEVCKFQNKLRAAPAVVPEYALRRMHKQFESPSEEVIALYDEVITVTSKFMSPEAKEKIGK